MWKMFMPLFLPEADGIKIFWLFPKISCDANDFLPINASAIFIDSSLFTIMNTVEGELRLLHQSWMSQFSGLRQSSTPVNIDFSSRGRSSRGVVGAEELLYLEANLSVFTLAGGTLCGAHDGNDKVSNERKRKLFRAPSFRWRNFRSIRSDIFANE
jgi:hypothetical protein